MSVSVTQHVTGGDFIGSTTNNELGGQYLWYRVAKADGGYDFYRVYQRDTNTAPDIRLTNIEDVSAATGYSTSQLSTQADETTTSSSTASGPTQAQIDAVQAQAMPLYQKYIQSLGETFGKAKAQLQKSWEDTLKSLKDSFWSNAETNDKNFGQGLQQVENVYGARGLTDSSYKDRAVGDQRSTFYQNLNKLQNEFTNKNNEATNSYNTNMDSLNSQQAEKQAAADATLANLTNPSSPTFSDFSQLQSYYNNLGSSAPQINTSGVSSQINSDMSPYYQALKTTTASTPTTVAGMSQDELNKWLYGQTK